jgi:hypothetical protein
VSIFVYKFSPFSYPQRFSKVLKQLAVAISPDLIKFSPRRHILLFSDLPSIPSPTDVPTENLCAYYVSSMHPNCLVELIPLDLP